MDTKLIYAGDFSRKVWDLVKDAVLIEVARPFQGELSWGVDYVRSSRKMTVWVRPDRNMVVWVSDDAIGGFDTLEAALPKMDPVGVQVEAERRAEAEIRSTNIRRGPTAAPPWGAKLSAFQDIGEALENWSSRYAKQTTRQQYRSAARALARELPKGLRTPTIELRELFQNGTMDRAIELVKPTVRKASMRFLRDLRERT